MTVHNLYHGGRKAGNANNAMYPAAETTPNDGLRQSAHKDPIAFGNTRLLDFSGLDNRRQAGLLQYLETHNISVGDEIVLCALPEKSFLLGFSTDVEFAEEGIAFEVKTKYGGLDLGTLSLASVDSQGVMLDEPKWLKRTDYIVLKVTAWPAREKPNKARFSVTPLLFVPKIGN